MSGNPFRRPGASNGRELIYNDPTGLGDGLLKTDAVSTVGRIKKVQFVSPPQSPEDAGPPNPFPSELESEDTPRSPPPQGSNFHTLNPRDLLRSDVPDEAISSFNQKFPEEYGVNSGFPLSRPDQGPTAFSSGRIEGNPFAKGSNTSQNASGLHENRPRFGIGPADEQTARAPNKAAMDVDAFTKMLMTGNAASGMPYRPESLKVVGQNFHSAHGSAGLHSPQGLDSHSPDLLTEDAQSDQDDAEHVNLIDEARSMEQKYASSSHQKDQPPTGPEIVSFADFDTSFATPSSPKTPRVSQLANGARPVLARSTSDLNKPLPPPPREATNTEVGLTISERPGQLDQRSDSVFWADETTPAKKVPPPPPPASRRKGSSKADSVLNRTRGDSDVSQTSNVEDSSVDGGDLHLLDVRPTRPARPPRRVENPISRETSGLETQGARIKPPPPPSRGSAKQVPPLSRTPSMQSTTSTGTRRISPGLGAAAPPPPPRPRRSEAKRASYEGQPNTLEARRSSVDSRRSSKEMRRVSGQSFGTDRRESTSSLQQVAEHETGLTGADEGAIVCNADSEKSSGSAPDILADMSAFQQELDALRSRAGKTS